MRIESKEELMIHKQKLIEKKRAYNRFIYHKNIEHSRMLCRNRQRKYYKKNREEILSKQKLIRRKSI
jgi:hypothetical protein